MTPSNTKLSKNWLYTLVVVVLFIGSACSLVSPKRTFANSVTATPTSLPVASTPTSMPVMIATQPPSVLPTNTQQAPAAQLSTATQMAMPPAMTQSVPQPSGTAKVLLDDNFSSQDISTKNGWTFGTSDSFDQQWVQGMQTFNLKSANNIFWDYLPQTYQDVALTIEVQPATAGYVEYGIIFAIVPGTGTPDADHVSGFKTNVQTYYLGDTPCKVPSSCDLVGIPYPASLWPIVPGPQADKWNTSVATGESHLNGTLVNTLTTTPGPVVLFRVLPRCFRGLR